MSKIKTTLLRVVTIFLAIWLVTEVSQLKHSSLETPWWWNLK